MTRSEPFGTQTGMDDQIQKLNSQEDDNKKDVGRRVTVTIFYDNFLFMSVILVKTL